MALLRLSEPAREAIREVAKLDNDTLKELNDFVGSNLESLLSQDDTFGRSSSLKRLSHDEAFKILDVLVPVIFTRLSSATDVKSEIDSLVRAVAVKAGAHKWTKADEKKLRQNLSLLLENPKTRLKSKSIRLMTTHAKQFVECEVVSDIRPVFSTDGKLAAEAGVVCHTLRVNFVEHEHEHRNIFLGLDANDLRALKKAIDRAIQKDELLGGVITKAGLEHVKIS